MDLRLNRIEFRADGIFSELIDARGKCIAHVCEHAYDSKPKLPDGVYKCVRGVHQLHNAIPFETFEVSGVPGHMGILFHVGNWPQIDSDGCILVGDAVVNSSKGRMVTNSKVLFQAFMQLQTGIKEFTLTVRT